MGLVVMILDQHRPPSLLPSTVDELTRLGITDISLVTGDAGSALVLSGWSFDGPANEHQIRQLVAPGRAAPIMHGVADVVLRPRASTASTEHGRNT